MHCLHVCIKKELIKAYVTHLRDSASHCEYSDSAKELIRDRLVCGIRDNTLQRALLAIAKLTFNKAFELALLHESTAHSTRLLTAYITRLCDLASHYEYSDSAKELIRDGLVCGVRDDTYVTRHCQANIR